MNHYMSNCVDIQDRCDCSYCYGHYMSDEDLVFSDQDTIYHLNGWKRHLNRMVPKYSPQHLTRNRRSLHKSRSRTYMILERHRWLDWEEQEYMEVYEAHRHNDDQFFYGSSNPANTKDISIWGLL